MYREICPYCESAMIESIPDATVDWCGNCGTIWTYSSNDRTVRRPAGSRPSWVQQKLSLLRALFN